MNFTRQMARSEERRIDKHLEKMAKLEETTKRLVDIGVLRKKKKPLLARLKDMFGGDK